jgi:hypothetical protein
LDDIRDYKEEYQKLKKSQEKSSLFGVYGEDEESNVYADKGNSSIISMSHPY